MYFAEFYIESAISDRLIPACGDRSVYILDGRNTRDTQKKDAKKWARRHGFLAYRICKGESFTRSRALTAVFRTASQ